MSKNIKAFLEADALRTKGKWDAEECGAEEYWVGWKHYNVGPAAAILGEPDAAFIAAASRIAPDLAKMVEDMRVAKEALEYISENDIAYIIAPTKGGKGYPGHFGHVAKKALTRLKPYEKLLEKEGER